MPGDVFNVVLDSDERGVLVNRQRRTSGGALRRGAERKTLKITMSSRAAPSAKFIAARRILQGGIHQQCFAANTTAAFLHRASLVFGPQQRNKCRWWWSPQCYLRGHCFQFCRVSSEHWWSWRSETPPVTIPLPDATSLTTWLLG
jgi:hypothetical protein